MDMDTAMAEDEVLKDELAGSTAVVVLVKDKVIYCVSITFKQLFVFLSFIQFVLNLGKCWRFESHCISKWCSRTTII